MLRRLCLIMSFAMPAMAFAQRPPLVMPERADAIVERLPKGYAALVPERPVITAAGRLAQAQLMLATAARTCDARLATRAEALLAGFPADDAPPAVIRARAYAAQHRHDFDVAVGLLDRLIRNHPRDGPARLSRAQILLVQGHLERARRDCAVLAFGVDSARGLLCIAALSLRTGEAEAAAGVLDRWLAQPDADAELRRHALVIRGEVAARIGAADAEDWFKRALALAPDDVRTLAAYARHLRHQGRHAQVQQLLAKAPDVDGLHLERTLAAHASGQAVAPAMIAAQARRYQMARAVGGEPELRDEAQFALALQGDPERALALAQRNFATQRDAEDVDLLIRAARAAKRPDALQPLKAWADEQNVVLPSDAASTSEGDAA